MVKTAHSDFEIDPATKQGEGDETSSQSTQPSQQYMSIAALVAAIDAES